MDAILASLAELLPNGGLVCSMQACFDDGGTGDASITCVAGYFLPDEQLAAFKGKWRELLGPRRFHMVDLVHGYKDFADMSPAERDKLVRGLIETIKQHMTLGVAMSISHAAHESRRDQMNALKVKMRSPFAMAAALCLAESSRWLERSAIAEEIAYSFETGNRKQGDANNWLAMISNNESMESRYNYVSHGFVKKNRLAALDAADLLGWEWIQECKRLSGAEKRLRRKSLDSLFAIPHLCEHYDEKNIVTAFIKVLLEPYVLPDNYEMVNLTKLNAERLKRKNETES